MSYEEERGRWRTWLTQAQRFAETDNHIDSMGRIDAVLTEIAERLRVQPEETLLERERIFFEKQRVLFKKEYDVWRQSVVARNDAYEAHEKAIYQAEEPGGRRGS